MKKQKLTSFLWILAVVNLVEVNKAQTYDSVTNLRSTLLTSYNPDVLPLDEQSDTLNINLTMYVFMISDVDQVQGAITMGVMVKQEWYDERLTWDTAAHNGTSMISIKSEDVWSPPLTVGNPVVFTVLDKSWMQVMYQNNGKATYTVGGVVSFTCSFFMKFWPYDKQLCSLNLFMYGYSAARLTLSVPDIVVNTEYYSDNGEWNLDKNAFEYTIEPFFGANLIKYSFKIERLPAFYLLTVILPVNGIGALTCLVFLLPNESGERVSYAITIMLSLAVFLTVAADDLPRNSEPVPVMCLFIFFNLVVCVCALVFVILNLILFNRSENVPIARYYKDLVRISRCRLRRNQVKHETNQSPIDNKARTVFNVRQKSEFTERKISVSPQESEESDVDEEVTWLDVSRAIDKILFVIMVVATYVPSVIILIYISAGTDYVEQ